MVQDRASHLEDEMIPVCDYVTLHQENDSFAYFLHGDFGALWGLHLNFWGKVLMETFVFHKKYYKMVVVKIAKSPKATSLYLECGLLSKLLL